jgi:hypothetical protein
VSIALVMTVRDEAALLRPNLLYHHYMGVDLAFVYFDGSTDGSLASIASLPFVHAGVSVGAERFAARADLGHAVPYADTHVTARQVLDISDALERARAAGCAWLLAIDADELVAPHLADARPGALRALLESVPAGTQCVQFPTLEVLQGETEYDNVFAEATLFKRDAARLRRRVKDPLRDRVVGAPGFYGHRSGKSALRLSADAVSKTPHAFAGRDDSVLPTLTAGHLLHYYCYSFQAFLTKFRRFHDHPDRDLWGRPVAPLKRLWRDVVNHPGFTEADLRAYYRAWVMFAERDIARLRRPTWLGLIPRRPPVVEVRAPQRVFEALARAPVGAGA